MKYPAFDVEGVEEDFLLAFLDDFGPTAVDTHDSRITIFFADSRRRNEARDAVVRAYPEADVRSRDVDDEDWAKRSQQDLKPITVGKITIAPRPDVRLPGLAVPNAETPTTIVIAPSMGFGTGHHATTRLCLRALQQLDLAGRLVLDVGTGSGILAIVARVLGARFTVGIDDDRDAIQAAGENLAANPGITNVEFSVQDLRSQRLPMADVITANLTGALLIRSADVLLNALTPGGALIVSGLQAHERGDVSDAFRKMVVEWEESEDDWVGMTLRV